MLLSRVIANGAINKRRRRDIRDIPTSYLGSYFPDSCKHHIHISLHLPSYNPAERVRKLILNSPWFLRDLCWPAGSQPTRLPSREDLTQNNQPAARASGHLDCHTTNCFPPEITLQPLLIEYLLSPTPRNLALESTLGFSIVPRPVTPSGGTVSRKDDSCNIILQMESIRKVKKQRMKVS